MVYLGGEEVEEEGVCGKSFPCFARTEEEEKEEAIGGGRERDMQRERGGWERERELFQGNYVEKPVVEVETNPLPCPLPSPFRCTNIF